MAIATLHSLRDRMTPPAARPGTSRPGVAERPAGLPARAPEVERALRLATDLFGVAAAALVLAGPDGLEVAAASAPDGCGYAIDAARRLFEVLATAEPSEAGRHAGVMEEVTSLRGFLAATPVLSASGRCLGAICLVDGDRRMLLTALQRRLFAEFGDLVAPALRGSASRGAAPERGGVPPDGAARLQALADADPDAFALFDPEGRCLLRSSRFDALLGADAPAGAPARIIPVAPGGEADWLALHLARDAEPVGVYRAARADGRWLSIEERRGPHGRSLVARVEEREAFGAADDMQLLFERCPFPMFVFDRDTRAILAVNRAALALYGWERDAFLRLDLDGIGPVGSAPVSADPCGRAVGAQDWTHRTRDGRTVAVSGRTTGLSHGGRPAVLVTVMAGEARASGRAPGGPSGCPKRSDP